MSKPDLLLTPGDRAEMTFRRSFDWPPGPYNIEFTCKVPLLNEEGELVLRCELIFTAAAQSAGSAKPGDEPTEGDMVRADQEARAKELEEDRDVPDEMPEA
jgi:hypothetical protein